MLYKSVYTKHVVNCDTIFGYILVPRGGEEGGEGSDVISKSYEELKREVEDRSWCKKRAS